jgi:hypothetical protein
MRAMPTEPESAAEPASAPAPASSAQPEQPRRSRRGGRERYRAVAFTLALLPGALIVYLGFTAGGYYPGSTATAAAVLALLLGLRFLLLPVHRPSPLLIVAGVSMAGYVLWCYLSQDWSGSIVRGSLAADRGLLYLLTLLLLGSLPADDRRLRWMIRGVAAGIAIVGAAALASRLVPDFVTTPITGLGFDARLSFPLTYWNALGILAASGLIFCVHLTKSAAEARTTQALAAAAVPMLGVVLYLTLSRGAILTGAVGLLAYLVLARNQGTVAMGISVIPTTALAVAATYQADILVTSDYATAEGMAAGERIAGTVLACMLAAAAIRVLLAGLESRLTVETPLSGLSGRTRIAIGAGVGLCAVVAVAVVFGAQIQQAYNDFFENSASPVGTGKSRLTVTGGSGRSALWDVGMESFRADPLKGGGAGNFAVEWLASGSPVPAQNAHSLYVETLSDLGLVGLLLLGTALLAIMIGVLSRLRGNSRTVHAAVFGAMLAWALHNGVDWDWEVPATTIWVFALGGAVLAHRIETRHPAGSLAQTYSPALSLTGRDLVRIGLAAACFIVGLFPTTIAISQSRIDHAVADFESNKCAPARSFAADALGVAPWRPEPHVILGYCAADRGDSASGVREMELALRDDPRNSEYLYAYAQALAADGRNASDAIQSAVDADPANLPLAVQASAIKRAGGDAAELRRIAATSPRVDLSRGANTFDPIVVPATPDPAAQPAPVAPAG